ncbi:M4 family metallopeptidase [Pyxidicoccus xibeiensis]|uniref:M4 family metallopeptidase n=1 Tax=Pyxidicoccus xibeiensis TaxID=2906759 RepID=UPI0020A75643|nr:M4 family metallopeptidase [Pyxidicoccus xibeiensis]MCP3145117.1 M4 family metallopeptidase [Pyxidicoccus xibeiensis]
MVEKRMRGALGVSMLTLLAGACTEAPPREKQAPEAVARRASTALADGLQVVSRDAAAVPTFITGPLGLVPTQAEAVKSIQRGQLLPALAQVAAPFRLAPEDLDLTKAYVGFDGDAHFRFAVRQEGVEVLGAELRLHARNGAVFAANTNMRGDLRRAPSKATVAPEAAIAAAKADRAAPAGAAVTGTPRLVYWRDGGDLVLAYEVRVTGMGEDGVPVDDSVLVNASNGDVFERLPHIHAALNRQVVDGDGGPGRSEGQQPVENPLVNIAYDHLGSAHECYRDLFGYDSYDGAGATLHSTVYRGGPFFNAFWDGTRIVLREGGVAAPELSRALDVIAHEFTHGVIDHTSGLIYSGESGGLNEGIADIFGAVCEWHGRGKVVDANTWLFAEDVWTPDIPGDALRYMHDPKLDGVSLDSYADYVSGTDVHYSSGIANLAFYLLSQGGLHPRTPNQLPVTGIGIEKAARIFYKANVDLLLPSSNFEAAKTATEQAAAQLGYDAATVTSVTRAWTAVQVGIIRQPPSTPLEKDVPATNLSGARGQQRYFSVVVPEGATDLTFTLAGGTGDADLYVRQGSAPTTTSYDCRPYRAGNNEVCTFAAPAHGTWYAMLNGFSAYSGASLVVTWKGGYIPVEPGVLVTDLSGEAGASQVFTVQIPEPAEGAYRTVHARLRGTGNADLYVLRGAAPTPSAYDCRSMNEHSTENCDLSFAEPGKYYVRVYGAKGGYTAGSLIVTYD